MNRLTAQSNNSAAHVSVPLSDQLKKDIEKEAKRTNMRKGPMIAVILEMYFEEFPV